MKAVFYNKTGSLDYLQFGDISQEKKPLQEGQLRLRFLAGALNHLDLWVLKGLPRVEYHFPHVVGADGCFQVIESSSDKFKKGDRVVVYPASGTGPDEHLSADFKIRGENTTGVFQEEVVVDAAYAFSAVEYLSDEQNASLPLTYLTAWQMLAHRAGLFPGKFDQGSLGPILIYGAGSGVTHALLELLLSMDIKNIALCSREQGKLEAWKKRGVHAFEVNEKLYKQLKEFSEGRGFSIIFDHVGERFFEDSIRLLAYHGKLISCGASSGPKASFDLRHFYFRQLQLLGSTMGSLRHFAEVMGHIRSHKIEPEISHIYGWSDPQEAFKLIDQGLQNGKIVLRRV